MQKKQPLRMCVACRESTAKSELIRVVRSGGVLLADPGGKLPGRGAYLHRNAECLKIAAKKGGVQRALKCGAGDCGKLYEEIGKIISGN